MILEGYDEDSHVLLIEKGVVYINDNNKETAFEGFSFKLEPSMIKYLIAYLPAVLEELQNKES